MLKKEGAQQGLKKFHFLSKVVVFSSFGGSGVLRKLKQEHLQDFKNCVVIGTKQQFTHKEFLI